MPVTTKAAVLLTAPELSTVTDARFDQAIADAEIHLPGIDRYGTAARQELVARLFVAHVLTLRSAGGGANGSIQSKSIGGIVSVTYAATSLNPAALERTTYGAELRGLLRGAHAGPMVL